MPRAFLVSWKPPNKRIKQTKPEHDGGSQLIPGVRRAREASAVRTLLLGMEKAMGEAWWYFLFGGLATLPLLIAVLLALVPITFLAGPDRALVVGIQATCMVASVFICGIPANSLFTGLLRGRAYVAADPLVDWIPWFPSGDWILDKGCGGRYLSGWSTWPLRAAWAVFALPTWLAGLSVFRWIGRYIGWWA
jgi:hypothetical protein